MEIESIVEYLRDLAPYLADFVLDELIRVQRDIPEVVEVLMNEKERRQEE